MKSNNSQSAVLTILSIFLLTVSFPAFASATKETFKTSFDCTKAGTTVEIAICSEKQLADADREMAELYKSVMAGVSDDEKNRLKHEQRDWLKNRNKSCGNSAKIVECIKDSYDDRLGTLKKLASSSAPGSAYPVKWYEGFELHNYFKDGKQPGTLEELRQMFQTPWEYPVTVYGSRDASYSVGNCADIFKAKKEKFYPVSNLERGPYSFMGVYCTAAKLILEGKPAQKSFIENLKIDGTIAKYLPANVEYIISNEQKRHTSGSWADVEKVKVASVTKKEVKFLSDGASHFVRRIAVGDFNGDGVQDLLFMVGHHVEGGTHFENSLYLMTRFGPNDLLKTIAKYTALEDD